jgi:predicted MFS family arabinose efflux permease
MTPSFANTAAKNTLWTAIFLALAIAVVNGFGRFAYALILPAMREDLLWDYAASGWLNTANSIGYALGGLSGMLLLTRFRSSRLFMVGLIATIVCVAAVGLTRNLSWMLLWRFIAGVGSAWVFSCGGALVAARYSNDPQKAGSAIAIFFAGGGLGIALSGLVVFPVLSGGMTWAAAWMTLGLVGAMLAVMPILSVRNIEGPRTQLAKDPFPWQNYTLITFAYFLFGLGYIVYMTFVIAWLKEMKLGVLISTSLWVVMGIAIMASGWVWQRPMANWKPTTTFAAASMCTALGSALPIIMRSESALLLSVIMVGGSFFMVPASMTALARKTLPQSLWAKAMNMFTMVFAVGQAIGPVLAGWIADTAGMNQAMFMGALVLMVSSAIGLTQFRKAF